MENLNVQQSSENTQYTKVYKIFKEKSFKKFLTKLKKNSNIIQYNSIKLIYLEKLNFWKIENKKCSEFSELLKI